MEAVVFNHNTMNELTWREVGGWVGGAGRQRCWGWAGGSRLATGLLWVLCMWEVCGRWSGGKGLGCVRAPRPCLAASTARPANPRLSPRSFSQVARWESLHYNECGAATLLRFRGRPDDLSPLARLSSWFGGPLPFDRHDWCVRGWRGGCGAGRRAGGGGGGAAVWTPLQGVAGQGGR